MDKDFTLAGELTEQGISGDRQILRPQIEGQDRPVLTSNGGWGLVLGAIVLWAIWRVFPGNEPRQTTTTPPEDFMASPSDRSSETARPGGITVTISEKGVLIENRGASPASAAAAASRPVKADRKAVRVVTPTAPEAASDPAHNSQSGD